MDSYNSNRPYTRKKSSNDSYVDISSRDELKKVYNKKSKGKRITAFILSLVLLITGSGMIYYYSILNSMNFKDISTVSNKKAEGNDLALNNENNGLLHDSKVLNVMLFGEDNDDGSGGRSDTMILLSIDNRNKKLKLTSFLRDTYVSIPGYYHSRLNAAYSLGGAQLSVQTIEANFGIQIDRYAVVDFDSFKAIIEVLNGIDIELSQDEIDYINLQSYKNKQTELQNEITDPPGKVHLNGRQALWYARNRGFYERGYDVVISGDDFDRTTRQRKLINTVFNDFKSASLPQIIAIIGKVGPMVTTNFKNNEITALVSQSLKYLKYDMEEYSVPQDGLWYDYTTSLKEMVLQISDWDESRRQLAEFIYEDLITGENSLSTTESD